MIFEGRVLQAEETARAKPGVRLSWTCVKNRSEGIRMLRGEPLGHESRESQGGSTALTICGLVDHCRNLGFYSKRDMKPWGDGEWQESDLISLKFYKEPYSLDAVFPSTCS